MITQAELKKLLRYEPKTGKFYWRKQAWHRNSWAGRLAGCIQITGHGYRYCKIMIAGKCYRVSHLAWLYVHGFFPAYIDHKNRDSTDDRIANLRQATHSQNMANSKGFARSGLKGVYTSNNKNKWQANIKVNGKATYIGLFDTPEAAHAAYCAAAKKLHGRFFCAGEIK